MDAFDQNGFPFVVGARVVAVCFVDRYADFLLPPGVTGTISDIDETGHGTIRVLVDLPWRHMVGAEHNFEVDCYGHSCSDATTGRELTVGEVCALEWIVTSLPVSNGGDPSAFKPRPSITSVALTLVDYMRDNADPGTTERVMLQTLVKRGTGPDGWQDIGDRFLREARYPVIEPNRERLDAEVKRIAGDRFALFPKASKWRITATYTIAFAVTAEVEATESEARLGADDAVMDICDGIELALPSAVTTADREVVIVSVEAAS